MRFNRLVVACRASLAFPLRIIAWNVFSVLWAGFVRVAGVSVGCSSAFTGSVLINTANNIAAGVAGVSSGVYVAMARAVVVFLTTTVGALCALAVRPFCWCHGFVLG